MTTLPEAAQTVDPVTPNPDRIREILARDDASLTDTAAELVLQQILLEDALIAAGVPPTSFLRDEASDPVAARAEVAMSRITRIAARALALIARDTPEAFPPAARATYATFQDLAGVLEQALSAGFNAETGVNAGLAAAAWVEAQAGFSARYSENVAAHLLEEAVDPPSELREILDAVVEPSGD